MTRSKGTNWLLGCGCGCAGLLLLAGLLASGGLMVARDAMSGFEDAVESREQLEERYGEAADFTPAPDGAVTSERMELFLAIRDELEPARRAIEGFFAGLPMSDEEARALEEQPFLRKIGSVVRITRSAVGFGGDLGEFFDARNRLLAERGMGIGEYTYIYALAYYSWLGRSPSDGPERDEGVSAEIGSWRGRVRRDLVGMLENQLAALPEGDASPAAAKWRAALSAELEALDGSRRRLPWEEGLPPAIAASFEPYRERLEALYSETTNTFELARTRRRGRFSVTAD